ncbi:MAG: hypothetical protein MAGBODY4_01658 [Candidatus Marinimicrobia bacterium]|nr:hypothetical protein [Candidatus Neomarinimicrobiota bacterium]
MNWVEGIGYLGSFLIAVSLTMNNIWRLRWANMIGAAVFTLYGVLISSYPIVLLNGFITAVDIFYLVKMTRTDDYFSMLNVQPDSVFLRKFYDYYKENIHRHSPHFHLNDISDANFVFILRNMIPVGLFVYEPREDGQIFIHLDYVIPDYRDLKNARYLFSVKTDDFREQGYERFVTKSSVDKHQQYLREMGFQPYEDEDELFFKQI